MQYQLKLYSSLMCLTLATTIYSQGIQVKFQVPQLSVNVAEGTTELLPNFIVFTDTLNVEENSIDSIDLVSFPIILYADIESVTIEKKELGTEEGLEFEVLGTYQKSELITGGSFKDHNFIQGTIYAYRLSVNTITGQKLVLINKSVSVSIADPRINCAKFNTVYRKSCHNCFQKDIVSNVDYSTTPWSINSGLKRALDYTRVLELDIYSSKVLGGNNASGVWNVRHGPKLQNNNNNCRLGDRDFGICLQDVIDWHNDPLHAGHDPITIYVDLKEPIINNTNFWRPGHSPVHLDNLLQTVGIQNIYSPKELGGSVIDLRLNAQRNNWPSMGDLKDKFIFILTGSPSSVNEYLNDRGINGVAFVAMHSESISDAQNLSGIDNQNEQLTTFYNIRGHFPYSSLHHNSLNVAKNYAYPNNYISRVTTTQIVNSIFSFPYNPFGGLGKPDEFTEDNYRKTIQFQVNCPAPRNIWDDFSHWKNGVHYPENGMFYRPLTEQVWLYNNHIFSSHANVTQAVTDYMVAHELIVEPGAHYRMIAGNEIDLQPGVDFKTGSDVDVRIDDCEGANYSLRQATGEQLTQEQIDGLMHELNKDLYSYQPSDEYEIANLSVYPNPTTNSLNISFINYLSVPITFTLNDITGRRVLTKNYETQQEGRQKISVSISSLNNGTYFYTLQVGQQTYNGKVVKIAN